VTANIARAANGFSRQEDLKPSSDRRFGLVIATVFLVIAFWPLIHAEPLR
jgi:hypothetical protein